MEIIAQCTLRLLHKKCNVVQTTLRNKQRGHFAKSVEIFAWQIIAQWVASNHESNRRITNRIIELRIELSNYESNNRIDLEG